MFIVNDCLIGGDVVGRSESITIGLETIILGLGPGIEIWVVLGKNSSWTSPRIQLIEKGSHIRAKTRTDFKVWASLGQGWVSRANAGVHDIEVDFAAKEGSAFNITPSADSARRTFP